MYIMYLDQCKLGRNRVTHPLIHLRFKNKLCEALLHGCRGQNEVNNKALMHRPNIHMPSHTTTKRLCVVCKRHTPHTYCYQCRFKFMCWKEGCYQEHHEALAWQWYDIRVLCLPLKFACFSFPFFFPPHSYLLSSFLSYPIMKYIYAFEFFCGKIHKNFQI